VTALNPKGRTHIAEANSGQAAPPSTGSYCYSDAFYRYIEDGSIRSAHVIVPLVLRELSPASVLDVGCGAGAWLAEYRNCGIADYLGVDGAYVRTTSLLISADHFQSRDVAQAFDLGRKFDLVQCLEVGEHLPEASSDSLVENLARHGQMILFSAATPGQGGENHINEQAHEYWRILFAAHGYKPFDLFRPMIRGIAAVGSWYRRNIILYVTEAAIPELSASVRASGVRDDQAIPEMTSFLYRFQASVLLLLPVGLVSKIARVKHMMVIACRSLKKR
jgi:SAM-dependent methyltransferase